MQTRGDLRRLIQAAEVTAARLTIPHHRLTMGERQVVAAHLTALCQVARRAFDPDFAVFEAPSHMGGEDVLSLDLFDEMDGAA